MNAIVSLAIDPAYLEDVVEVDKELVILGRDTDVYSVFTTVDQLLEELDWCDHNQINTGHHGYVHVVYDEFDIVLPITDRKPLVDDNANLTRVDMLLGALDVVGTYTAIVVRRVGDPTCVLRGQSTVRLANLIRNSGFDVVKSGELLNIVSVVKHNGRTLVLAEVGNNALTLLGQPHSAVTEVVLFVIPTEEQ